MRRPIAALGLVLALAAGARAEAPTLNDSVVVEGNYIHLGDLFRHAGERADAIVAYAPAPGKVAMFDVNWLYRVAQAYGLGWRPFTLQDRATVRRSSQVICSGDIARQVREALNERGVDPELQVALSNPGLRLFVAADRATTVAIEDLAYDAVTRRFSAIVAAPADDPAAQRIRVTGRTFATTEVPVPRRRIVADKVITEGDLEWISMRSDRVPREAVMEATDLVGMVPRRSLRAGQPVRPADVGRPILVTKGTVVTMVVRAPMMTLTAKGRALDDGSEGDTVRIANTESKKVVDATVIGASTVTVNLAGQVAIN